MKKAFISILLALILLSSLVLANGEDMVEEQVEYDSLYYKLLARVKAAGLDDPVQECFGTFVMAVGRVTPEYEEKLATKATRADACTEAYIAADPSCEGGSADCYVKYLDQCYVELNAADNSEYYGKLLEFAKTCQICMGEEEPEVKKKAYIFVSYVGTEFLGLNRVPWLRGILNWWSRRALSKKIEWQREYFEEKGYEIIELEATADNLRHVLESDDTAAIAWFGHGLQGQLQDKDGNWFDVNEMKKWAAMNQFGLSEEEYHNIENKARIYANDPATIPPDDLEDYEKALDQYRNFDSAHFNLEYAYMHACHSLNGTTMADTLMDRNGFFQGFEGPGRTTKTISPYTKK